MTELTHSSFPIRSTLFLPSDGYYLVFFIIFITFGRVVLTMRM